MQKHDYSLAQLSNSKLCAAAKLFVQYLDSGRDGREVSKLYAFIMEELRAKKDNQEGLWAFGMIYENVGFLTGVVDW